MKIIHINKSDVTGGASVAASRIVKSLNENGVDVQMLVAEKKSNVAWVDSIAKSCAGKMKLNVRFLWEVLRFLPHEKSKQFRFAYSMGNSGFDLSKHPLVQAADIIHLHWFNQGFLSIKGLGKILKLGKPVVWTLHDMWGFTGGCHYSGECLRYADDCGLCRMLNNSSKKNISFVQMALKKDIYYRAQLYPVACSNWLAQIAGQSALFNNTPVTSIPNPIDIHLFKPINKRDARQKLGLPQDKKLILFGAANVADPRKGMQHLFSALQLLANRHHDNNIELVVFGKTPELTANKIPFNIHAMNYVSDAETLVNLYNAADVFVLPSLEDNLPNTVMEALACGLPVAAFSTGGVPEMVTHSNNGFLSSQGDEAGLAQGIELLLKNGKEQKFSVAAREKVETSFAPHIIAGHYEALYRKILNKEHE
ncbi:MAG: glycosyltransferase family 4 protein [Cytophagaceae bacterium]|jgi:glycosyltransferase involved in cell wall biosynthesis|nr:glycosyltransferase family 4 protein [Cytophagaceae bacterium]